MERLLIRDLFGNPFEPTASPGAWRQAGLALARDLYDRGDFGMLPTLTDALEAAGCNDRASLAHCRGPGPHVRGCWVVDLVLGKE